MSNAPSPYSTDGYISSPYSGSASPASARPTPPPGSKPGSSRNTPKPVNVFTNDGSFLERIQRSKREEQKRKEFEALEMYLILYSNCSIYHSPLYIYRKKNFENHFRKRGKRRHPEPAAKDVDPSKPDSKDHPVKKARFDNNSSKYLPSQRFSA
ncbi:hypothetical protein H2248_007133 [Termitomyces sp. 'cryptogamus']|nr:hypothetical protein H2248_007133 [Termitomyces sp. 'cryptogamus']